MSYSVGIDLGGTKMLITLAGRDGAIIAQRQYLTRAEGGTGGPGEILLRMHQYVLELLASAGAEISKLDKIALCVAGFYEHTSGNMLSSPNLPGWDNFPIKQELRNLFKLPVVVENDAAAAAYGEYLFGAGRGKRNMVMITLGTGIGGGLILEGELYRGGGFAGEIGHIPVLPGGPLCGCGRRGCLEALSSGTAVAREGRRILQQGRERGAILRQVAGDVDNVQAEDVFKAAAKGDEDAASVVGRAAYYLGLGLAAVVNVLNPELIVAGGGMAGAGDSFLKPVGGYLFQFAVEPSAKMVSLVPAMLGEEAGIRGILSLPGE